MTTQLAVIPFVKECSFCKEQKPCSEFYFRSERPDKLRSECKACVAQQSKKWKKDNPQRTIEFRRTYYQKNVEKVKKVSHGRYNKQGRLRQLHRKYGITPEAYEAMLDAQKNRCAICGDGPRTRALAVDHCHTSGKIRGLLCGQCNTGVGNFKDNPLLLQAAITYLELKG